MHDFMAHKTKLCNSKIMIIQLNCTRKTKQKLNYKFIACRVVKTRSDASYLQLNINKNIYTHLRSKNLQLILYAMHAFPDKRLKFK